MKIAFIVGARPQFIKAAPLGMALGRNYKILLIHTGQHYDSNLSEIFFKDLNIVEPDYNLGVGSGNHGLQTGKMLISLEKVLLTEKPDWVIVYGDTNSTLAGAIAASKLHIPIAHVEAGLRSFNRRMPEEINRVITDHISNLLLCPTETAVDNLSREGIRDGVHWVGDVMYDALLRFLPIAEEKSTILESLEIERGKYYLATVHRAENTENPERLRSILLCLEEINDLIIFPMHPRTANALEHFQLDLPRNVCVVDPVGYLNMLILQKYAMAVLTDSGGIQKEAYFLGVPCITMRNETEWIETVETGWNVLVDVDPEEVKTSINKPKPAEHPLSIFGDGKASDRIAEILENVNLS
jgi:UDP-N-acetylglucosamine 2-epimerase